jgi:hypothetical protein
MTIEFNSGQGSGFVPRPGTTVPEPDVPPVPVPTYDGEPDPPVVPTVDLSLVVGIPPGGLENQFLQKASDVDFSVRWADVVTSPPGVTVTSPTATRTITMEGTGRRSRT